MNLTVEKTLIMLIISVLVLASATTLALQGGVLTREEAIAISKNTPIVQEALSRGKGMMITETDYWSADYIEASKKDFLDKFDKLPDVYEKLPDDHGVWRVHWDVTPPGYQILHFIDELTGQIPYEEAFVAG